jgi:ATP-dependent protease ClpP protease subunit
VRRKSREQVLEDANRDLWLDAEEAKAYGIIDGATKKKNKNRNKL